jgi:hypothetical protein
VPSFVYHQLSFSHSNQSILKKCINVAEYEQLRSSRQLPLALTLRMHHCKQLIELLVRETWSIRSAQCGLDSCLFKTAGEESETLRAAGCHKIREHFSYQCLPGGTKPRKLTEKNPHICACESPDQLFHRTGRSAEEGRGRRKMDQRSIVMYLARNGLSAVAIHNDFVVTLCTNAISYS